MPRGPPPPLRAGLQHRRKSQGTKALPNFSPGDRSHSTCAQLRAASVYLGSPQLGDRRFVGRLEAFEQGNRQGRALLSGKAENLVQKVVYTRIHGIQSSTASAVREQDNGQPASRRGSTAAGSGFAATVVVHSRLTLRLRRRDLSQSAFLVDAGRIIGAGNWRKGKAGYEKEDHLHE